MKQKTFTIINELLADLEEIRGQLNKLVIHAFNESNEEPEEKASPEQQRAKDIEELLYDEGCKITDPPKKERFFKSYNRPRPCYFCERIDDGQDVKILKSGYLTELFTDRGNRLDVHTCKTCFPAVRIVWEDSQKEDEE